MALWALFLGVYILLTGVSIAGVLAFNHFILVPLVTGPDYTIAISASIAVTIFILVLFAGVFFLLSRKVVGSIYRLNRAMRQYTETGMRADASLGRGVPKEIYELDNAFLDLIAKVQEAHGRDADVSRMKSDFISTAAHQLRTPLTGVRWALEALQKSGLNPDQQVLVQNAVDKSHELVGIVGTLLDISSIESGKYKYSFEEVDLIELAQKVAHDFAPMAAERQVSLLFEGAAGTIPHVRADKERIRWIINNLVENAIRYTPAAGSIRITTDANQNLVYLRVHDTGIGISTQDKNSIFERFYRGENARAKENAGNGLGLYIARTVATDHGGNLSFEANKEGPGTTFILSLPVAGTA